MTSDAPQTTRLRGRPKAFHDRTAQNLIQSVDRALWVLELIARHDGIALSDLARAGGTSAATTYRILTTLKLHDIVEEESTTQLWFIGSGAFRIGSAFQRRTNVLERSQAPMRTLMRATGETANLGIEQDEQVMFVSQVETHEAIRAFFPPGTRSPMHASGIGKALLAHYPEDKIDRIVAAQGLEGFTLHTLTQPSRLKDDLRRIRQRGYSVDDQEKNEGMRCIAAPVFNAHGAPVAGLSISGPVFRLPLNRASELGAHVARAASEVTRAIGGQYPGTPQE